MTSPIQGKLLLSDKERERLFNPNLDTATRKRNNLIVKRKIKNWLNQAEDVIYALNFLTDTQLERTIPDSDVYALFKVTEALLDRLNFAPVKGETDNPYVDYFSTVLRDFPKSIRRRAKESDFDRAWKVQKHVEALQSRYPHSPENESPAYKMYREKRESGHPSGVARYVSARERSQQLKEMRIQTEAKKDPSK